jgi:hypothetical protein
MKIKMSAASMNHKEIIDANHGCSAEDVTRPQVATCSVVGWGS